MLTEEQIKQILDTESAKDCYAKPYSYGVAVARAIESAVRAEYLQGVKVSVPTAAMEQSFQWHYKRGFDAGIKHARAEYADVPPHRFKTLYRAANNWRNNDSMPNDIFRALLIIDNGTYNPKIGGEE